jgi:hypothetical protein
MHNISLHFIKQASAKLSLMNNPSKPLSTSLKIGSANRKDGSLYGGLTSTETEAT